MAARMSSCTTRRSRALGSGPWRKTRKSSLRSGKVLRGRRRRVCASCNSYLPAGRHEPAVLDERPEQVRSAAPDPCRRHNTVTLREDAMTMAVSSFLIRKLDRRLDRLDLDGNGYVDGADFAQAAHRMGNAFGVLDSDPKLTRLTEIMGAMWMNLSELADR